MKSYDELTPKGKLIRKNLARLVIYGFLAVGFWFAIKRLKAAWGRQEPVEVWKV